MGADARKADAPSAGQVYALRRRPGAGLAGLVLVEGCREVSRALGSVPVRTVYYCPALWSGDTEARLLARATAAGAVPIRMAEGPYRRVSARDGPDGLLAVAERVRHDLTSLPLGPAPLVLVVEAVEKPGNLGTILRSADAAGVSAVVSCDPVTDPFGPDVVRASLGCVFTVPLAVAGVTDTRRWLRRLNVRTVAATPAGERLPWDVDLDGPCALVVGCERRGLSAPWLVGCDERVRIPMAGAADSLNVAMAATSLLFEAVRQRACAPRRPSASPRVGGRARLHGGGTRRTS